MHMEHNDYQPNKMLAHDRINAFRAGQRMLFHAANAIRNGRPEKELEDDFDPQAIPLLAVALMCEMSQRVEQELHDDGVLNELEQTIKLD